MSRTLNTDPIDRQLVRLRGAGAPIMRPLLVMWNGEIYTSTRLPHMADRTPEHRDAEWPSFAPVGGCNRSSYRWGRDRDGRAPSVDEWDFEPGFHAVETITFEPTSTGVYHADDDVADGGFWG